ncbi:hypothetical protein KDH_26590 [Dictyobacter sp. S3.2.2.5]|uniref:Uncharacterized protein n=1 Tax=Dictyobacter halimunensis TaxID=3026934 RepID=A0ABQ6FQ54_9CHLR|nr:hypothetical protein KDH_26590 [Dictyobacter sp. S3.2.2.5]
MSVELRMRQWYRNTIPIQIFAQAPDTFHTVTPGAITFDKNTMYSAAFYNLAAAEVLAAPL